MRTLRAMAAGAALAALTAMAAQAATVTYTFTEYDSDNPGERQVVWQLRHTLADFLDVNAPDPLNVALFSLSDIVVDPWVASGHHTVSFQDTPTFSVMPGFILFGGAAFCNENAPSLGCQGSDIGGVSFDMHVSQDMAPGYWQAGVNSVEVTVSDDTDPPVRLPEPTGVSLLAAALAALMASRRRSPTRLLGHGPG